MPRVVSFIVLVAIVLLTGAMFFQVMVQFIVPLFLAAVLVVIFQPLHRWICRYIPAKPRLTAMATTILILLFVLVPTIWLGWNAYSECHNVFHYLVEPQERQLLVEHMNQRAKPVLDRYERIFSKPLDTDALFEHATRIIGVALFSSVQIFFSLLVGMAIMTLALYYFLVDGPIMIASLMRLSPLDDQYEQQLLDKFANVSRAVVVATLLAAVVQGLVAGVGYFFALPEAAPIFLLIALTMLLAIVPFVGAAAVWIPTCVWLALYAQRVTEEGEVLKGNWPVALGLALFCAIFVSAIDNVIKPMVLHGQSNLHPLLALLSVIGGVQALGPIGILVGPMLVAFMQALLVMLNRELQLLGRDQRPEVGSQRA